MTEEVTMNDPLPGWNDGAAKTAILEFVRPSPSRGTAVPVEERVAVFDNDGTLWCEKPMPIQLDFILRRLAEMAEAEPELRERQPWKAAYERDYAWFGTRARRALRGRRHQRADAARRHPGRLRGDQRRRLRGAVGRLPAQRAAPDPRSRLPRVRLRADGRAARLPARRTGSRTTSPRAAVATSCGRSARRCTASRASG